MSAIVDVLRGWRIRLQVAGWRVWGRLRSVWSSLAQDPRLLAVIGAVLLMCAPVLPGLWRLVVLPALLLAPGYAFLRLLRQTTGLRSISVAVPVSLVLAVCVSLLLDVSGIRLGPVSLGLVLGAVTALFVTGSYGRLLVADMPRPHRRAPSGDREPAPGKRPEAGDRQPIIGYVAVSEHDQAAFVAEVVDRLVGERAATPARSRCSIAPAPSRGRLRRSSAGPACPM